MKVEKRKFASMADVSESPSQSPVSVDETPSPSIPAKRATKQVNKKPIAAKKLSTKPSHPATSELVLNAIKTLQDRNGSSLQAIKKFIASHYKLDTDKLAVFIKKYLKNAVAAGKLIQTKGKGASGSFKLPATVAAKPVKAAKGKKIAESNDKKIKSDEKKEKKRKGKSTKKTSSAKKKHATSKKVTNKSGVSIKSATPKQKSTKPSKVASKVKAPKNKKAPSVKKAASAGGTEKKTPKTAKNN